MQHKQVIGINNNYKLLLSETLCYCYKLVLIKTCRSIYMCTKLGSKRMQHRKVIGINKNYKFLLPEAVIVVYKPVIFENLSGYTHQCTKFGDKSTQHRKVIGV